MQLPRQCLTVHREADRDRSCLGAYCRSNRRPDPVVGGFLSNLFRDAGVTNLNLYSFFVAIAGAVAFLIIFHARSIVGNVGRGHS